ncbi:MAG: tol-pal system protein YbgF [Methylococcales bacterium]|nr:MAG: tol-pal system protein YbgF [Methylococcales bacterium]
MKKACLIILLSACNAVYAELPTVVDHSSYPPSATPVSPVNAPSTNTLYELMGRLEQLQAEVQQLTGKVDEQAYRIDELKKRQGTLYTDFDERLQGIENKASSVTTPAVAPATENASATPGVADAATAEPKDSTGERASAPESASPVESVPANKATPPAVSASEESKAPANDPAQSLGSAEKQEYYEAYNELRNGHTKPSITLFLGYLSKYPKSAYANNAQYWLGEAYRVDQDNGAALKAFNDVIEKYPEGVKVPDALLRLGMLEQDQKNTTKAREYFTRVLSGYPKSTAAQSAQKKLDKLDEVKN